MIETVLGDPNVVASAKYSGIYGAILTWTAAVRNGRKPPLLPGESGEPSAQQTIPMRPSAAAFAAEHTMTQYQNTKGPPPAVHPRSPAGSGGGNQIVRTSEPSHQNPFERLQKPKTSEKALSFFTACLRVLNIQEEVALTEDSLKSAYKKAVIRVHPDKGGTKEAFDAVTRAYAYLMDILRLVQGQKGRTNEATPALDTVLEQRQSASAAWKMPEQPVRLNPKNLNMEVFNKMFEQTRVPDPDEDGYGDWLKGADDNQGGSKKGMKKFSEEFNRDVFNRMFEEEHQGKSTAITQIRQPQELTLAPTYGVELGRDRPSDYTAAINGKQGYTDLRAAYTTENMIQPQIANVRVEQRDLKTYKAQRDAGPVMYNENELYEMNAYEQQMKQREEQRRIRAAQEHVVANDYFERMKQLVITDK